MQRLLDSFESDIFEDADSRVSTQVRVQAWPDVVAMTIAPDDGAAFTVFLPPHVAQQLAAGLAQTAGKIRLTTAGYPLA